MSDSDRCQCLPPPPPPPATFALKRPEGRIESQCDFGKSDNPEKVLFCCPNHFISKAKR